MIPSVVAVVLAIDTIWDPLSNKASSLSTEFIKGYSALRPKDSPAPYKQFLPAFLTFSTARLDTVLTDR